MGNELTVLSPQRPNGEQVEYHKRMGTTRMQGPCCGSVVAVVSDGQAGALFALNGAIWA